MRPHLHDTIADLDERQTLISCRMLVLLMDRRMARDPGSGRPPDLVVTDFQQWVRAGGPPVRDLVKMLAEGHPALTAAAGRRLMHTCLRWGCVDEVRAACRLAYAPVHHLGRLTAAAVVGALAGVMRWHPERPALKTLLDREHPPTGPAAAQRRYPWFRNPSADAAKHAAPMTND
jgi:hypothetical protein